MFKIRNISIKNKLVLMQVFTSVIVLSIFFAAFILSDIQDYRHRKAKTMLGLAKVIGNNSISTLEFQDNDEAKKILEELSTISPEVIKASILDRNGKLFAFYSKSGTASFALPAALENNNFIFSGKELFVVNDIIDNGEKMGKVALEVELSELEAIKKTKYTIAAVLLLVALGVSVIIALLVQPYISKRLMYLVNKIKEVSQTGDYNQMISDNGKDEISTLIKAYNDLMNQVKQSQHRKDEFIGIASHELKTPLTSIKGYLQLLNSIEDKQPNKQCVEKALDNVRKLERLIFDLLDVSKIQSGQLELDTKEFDMDEMIEDTINSLQMVYATHKIIRKNKAGHTTIVADRQRIEQVLINLLSNAIKYSPGAEEVFLYSELSATDLTIRIRDFGIGIPPEEHGNIFKRFYRTRDMAKNISGFGLGLYICSDIIKRHNGRLWVEKEESGSSFYFCLPLKNTSI